MKENSANHWEIKHIPVDIDLNMPRSAAALPPSENVHDGLDIWLQTLAPLKVDLVLEGETGTGKDTFARRIYEHSGCRGAFVPINCAAIPETLAESELFGVTAGAYTGANHSRAGYIESANNGVLFLDEIDSMSLSLQAKLLRVLETRTVGRLGSTQSISLNLRVIVASQKPLAQLMEQKLFRQDLFFRLTTVKISLPALRERVECIIPLFRRFAQESALRLNRPLPPMPQNLSEALLMHRWPGNIRELKGAAERFVLGLPALGQVAHPEMRSVRLRERLRRIEYSLIEDCLSRHENRVVSAAHELGIPRRTLYQRIKSLTEKGN
ncbi:C4-dicarboxylate transport transcriptional regulatory protein dctD [Cedecea lapagei]|uniref:C4-dicarboxylate transport transcriptional regulatory protein dctD n=1 Tax=Cedecea lapagei TaxID=158823 RepID=A0A3S5DPV6_9ENTR|nr:sigma 54-interacting transcriptional regulator [Cedecea lapagei]VEB99387.1 C4-dicarboxylate transport transcriptional regulatory protein dctD [Cedecea lapagei]